MISIDLGAKEYYDEKTNQFLNVEIGVVRFEYSLKAVYEWEAKWRKPFLKGNLTYDESIDFYMMMAIDPFDVKYLNDEVIDILKNYISDSSTATTFSSYDSQNNNNGFIKGKIYTAEELYALMFRDNVPLEFENRNLNRLFIILRIISSYRTPPKKMSKHDILRQNAQLNAARKKALQTKG